jgi:5,10-methylene-tetrahydrofolate dehydrogenase/methenyl tetrahydrofolate cyclohydrolase
VIQAIDPQKDVDGFHPQNVGALVVGKKGFVSCTPAGIIQLLKRSNIEIAGKHCVVIGRSNIVGKPMALLMLLLLTGVLDVPLEFLRDGLLNGLEAIGTWPVRLLLALR